jgi:hypothetical protein
MMFIVMDTMDYIIFVPLFVDIYHIMVYNKFNKRYIRQRIMPFYVSMIDEHIIFVELESNAFNDLTSFNTNAHFCNGDVLINLNVIDAWYSGINNIMYVASCVDIC